MGQYKVSIGWFWFSISERMLVLGVDRDRLDAYAKEEGLSIPVARLRRQRPDHLTIPLEPRARGRDAGKFWIHLTYNGQEHVPIAVVDPCDVKRIGTDFACTFMNLILGSEIFLKAHRVDVNWLAERQYKIILPEDDCYLEIINSVFRRRTRQYTFGRNRYETYTRIFWGKARLEDPKILDDDKFRTGSIRVASAVHAGESAQERSHLVLIYRPHNPWCAVPGWYALPNYDLKSEHTRLKLMCAFSGLFTPNLTSFISTVCTELGIPLEFADFERLFSIKTPGMPSLPPPPTVGA